MPGAFSTDLLIGGLVHMTAAVAADRLHHAREVFQIMLQTPETATGEYGGLQISRQGRCDPRPGDREHQHQCR